MELDPAICYRALRTRDRRFDGRFFTGVASTGVYCRPVCPARTPAARNCSFFACAAAAEEAGYRPCRRCRPDSLPGTPAWSGTSTTVSRALRLIEGGALDTGGVEELAARLGVGGRHLRRLFAEQLGASPLAVAHTRRAHFAKRLVEETTLPLGQVALAAGFANPRRFNAAIRRTFQRTPTAIRAAARHGEREPDANGGTVTLRLAYREPLDWAAHLDFLRPRALPGVEEVTGERYRRTLELGDFAGVIEVDRDPAGGALRLRAPVAAAAHLADLVARARRLFDLDADPAAIAAALADDRELAVRLRRHPGLRVPGAWDPFETAVRAIVGQQVTVAGATRVAGRLIERFGRRLPGSDASPGPARLFPGPDRLLHADIAAAGMPGARGETIRALARAVLAGEPVLEPARDLAEAVARLTALPGIGDWTAHYVAMRALREPDAFPAGDLGLRKALAEGPKPVSAATARRRAERWRPWRAYAAMLLWRELPAPGRKDPS